MLCFAGVFIGVGCVFYPLGWDSAEVRQVCGETADKFHLGELQFAILGEEGWGLCIA